MIQQGVTGSRQTRKNRSSFDADNRRLGVRIRSNTSCIRRDNLRSGVNEVVSVTLFVYLIYLYPSEGSRYDHGTNSNELLRGLRR